MYHYFKDENTKGFAWLAVILMILLIAFVVWIHMLPQLYAKPVESQQYALTTKVVDLDFENDLVTCEDCNGNLWQFFGVEDWEIEDGASLLMNDSGTPEIWDDVIESVRFNNWTLTK
jgi:hypothetical protein